MKHSPIESRIHLAGFSYVGENLAAAANTMYTENNMLSLPIS